MKPDINTPETIGARIRRLRKERNLAQTALAESVGVTFGWISQIEQDKATASPELLNKIAASFKIPIRELLQDEDEHMELVSRIKMIEVLIETNQSIEAVSMILELEHHPDLSDENRLMLTLNLAECRYQQKRYDETLEVLQPLIQTLERENHHDAHLLAMMRNKIGNAYIQKQDTENALYNYQKAFDYTIRFVMFDELAAYISYNLGLTLRRKGRPTDSLLYLERAGEFYKHNNDLRKYADALFVQGIAHKNMKEYSRASDYFEQAKALYQSLNYHSLCTRVEIAVATSITYRDNPQQAFEDLKACAMRFEEEGYMSGVIFVYSKMANLQLEQHNYSDAESLLKQGDTIALAHAIASTHEIGELHAAFSKYYLSIEEYNESIKRALTSAEIFGILGLTRDQADSLKIAVESYRKIGDLENALNLQTQRSELLERLMEE